MPTDIYVATTGNDGNPGTLAQPKLTLAAALSAAAAAPKTDAITIWMRGGEYKLGGTATITGSHVPNSPHRLTIRNYGSEVPILTSRTKITSGWAASGGKFQKAGVSGATIRNVWDGDGTPLPRSSYGKYVQSGGGHILNPLQPEGVLQTRLPVYRINSPDVANARTFEVDGWPSVGSVSSLEFVTPIGWNISRLKVSSTTFLGNFSTTQLGTARHRVTFAEPGRQTEFAKGSPLPSDYYADFDMGFAVGPYHHYSLPTGHYYWLENAPEFLDRADNPPGSWFLASGLLTMKPLAGVTTAAGMNEREISYASAPDQALIIDSDRVTLRGLKFLNFGWIGGTGTENATAQGYVGYAGGLSLVCASGATEYRFMPAVVTVSSGNDIEIEACAFRGLGAGGISLATGLKRAVIRRCAFVDISGPAIMHYGVTATFDAMVEAEQTHDLTVESNYLYNVAWEYTGAAMFIGAGQRMSVRRNSIFHAPHIGINGGFGGRFDPNWVHTMVIEKNYLYNTMYLCADGGAIYCNNNMSGQWYTANPTDPLFDSYRLVIRENEVLYCFRSWWDLNGGRCPAIYLDIGVQGALVERNVLNTVDVGLQENGGKFNILRNNRVTTVSLGAVSAVFYSGMNRVTDAGTTLYTPPESPADEAATAKFEGGTYLGTTYPPFKDLFPFASINGAAPALFSGSTYQSLSSYSGNGSGTSVELRGTGIDVDTEGLWPEYWAQRFVLPVT